MNLYVDVDGVLNAVSWHAPDWDWPDAQLSQVDGYPIRWSASMVARLNRLADRADVTAYWLTTWGRRAAEILSPALGVEGADWSVVGDTERARAVDTLVGSARWWKLDAIRAHLPGGTPAVWIDDDLCRDPDALGWVEERGDVLPVSPATEFALTPQHFEQIEAYVDQCGSPGTL